MGTADNALLQENITLKAELAATQSAALEVAAELACRCSG
jgi:hypothetical protein